jgi:hypothetical protein
MSSISQFLTFKDPPKLTMFERKSSQLFMNKKRDLDDGYESQEDEDIKTIIERKKVKVLAEHLSSDVVETKIKVVALENLPLASFSSPDRKIVVASRPHPTPDDIRRAFKTIEENPKLDLTPSRERTLAIGINSISKVDSHEKKVELLQRARTKMMGSPDLTSPKSAKEINSLIKGSKSRKVAQLILNETNKIALESDLLFSPRLVRGVAFGHILKSQKGVGWHICSKDDKRYSSIQSKLTNDENGVWMGRFGVSAKFSSFFPESFSSEVALMNMTQDAKVVGYFEYGETKTYVKQFEEGNFYFKETEKNAEILTAFPFFFAKYYKELGDNLEIFANSERKVCVEKTSFLRKIKALSDIDKHKRIIITTFNNHHLFDISLLEGIEFEKSVALFLTSEELGYEPKW